MRRLALQGTPADGRGGEDGEDRRRDREGCRFLRAFRIRLSRRRLGKVAEPLAVTAHHPRLLFGYGMMEIALEHFHLVDARLKELAAIKSALMVGCEFCIDIGTFLARGSGIPEQQLRDLSRFHESRAFSRVEKLVLQYAAEMTKPPVSVSETLFEDLREHFDEVQLVELTGAIALENYRARFSHAFGMGSQGFFEAPTAPCPTSLL